MKMPKRNYKREAWLAKFELHVVKLDASQAGKIDWNTATHLYNSDITPEASAIRYVASRQAQ
jgi:hypothetical protein